MSRRRRPAWDRCRWPAVICLTVVIANLPAILGIVDVNPLALISGLATQPISHLLPGTWTVDVNVGTTSQALGHLAALDWLHGHVPWWNPYEGVGTPLAAEMQSAAFFPPTLLLAFSDGQLPMRMLLEAAAGLATYGLLLELGVARLAAGVGGVLFALNGTFAWFAHAAVNPVCLLPICLYGVELAVRSRLGDPRCLVLPAGLALSVVAGFPETAYVDGLLVVAWSLLRVGRAGGGERLRTAGRLALLGGCGVALAAPLIVAFVGFLDHGNVGGHVDFATTHLPDGSLGTIPVPYLFGPISAFTAAARGQPGGGLSYDNGFLTAGLIAVALLGALRSRRELGLRILLVVWVVIGLARSFGLVPLERLLAVLPEMQRAAFFRAVWPSLELSFVVLCALGLEVCLSPAPRRRRFDLAAAALVTAALTAAFVLGPSRALLLDVLDKTPASSHPGLYVGGALAWAFLVLALLAAGGFLASGGRAAGAAIVATVLVVDAVAMFMYPLFSAPRSRTVDTAPVAYLQAHLGTYRFFSTGADYANPGGPVTPNYGSYFAIASVDHFDIPVPKSWVDYVNGSLDPESGSLFFTGTDFGRVALSPVPVAELAAHLAGFERLGVRYVVSGAAYSGQLEQALPTARVVYRDPYAVIVELPAAEPYFSVERGQCALRVVSREQAVASCRGPATLVRRELAYPGWHVAVNGRSAPLSAAGPLFMGVALAPGRSVVTFGYRPPGAGGAELLALAALVVLLAPVVLARARSARGRAPARSGRLHAHRAAPDRSRGGRVVRAPGQREMEGAPGG